MDPMAKVADYLPYTGPLVTRAEAKAAGAKRYFTGKPCKRGHICERYTSIAQCVACSRAQTYEWLAANPERWDEARKQWIAANTQRINEQSQAWQKAHPEQRRETLKLWRLNNKEKHSEQRKEWRKANPHVYRAHAENRRARKLGAGGSYTAQQIDNLAVLQRHKCVGCGVSIKRGFEVDHIVALSKGGSSDISNIQLLCRPCNRSKHAKSAEQWAREQGRLL
jgi:5-methylcytosine-specific restriction endonuclease McrA